MWREVRGVEGGGILRRAFFHSRVFKNVYHVGVYLFCKIHEFIHRTETIITPTIHPI